MTPNPPPTTHGDGADAAPDRANTYQQVSSADQREADAGAVEPEPEPASGGGFGDDLPFLDHPGMNALAGAGAANAAGPGLTGPTVGADVGELATGEGEDPRFR